MRHSNEGKRISRQQSLDKPPLQLFWNLHEDQATYLLHMFRLPRSNPCMLFCWMFHLWEPPRSKLVDSLSFFGVPIHSGFLNPSHRCSTKHLKLNLMFGYGSISASVLVSCWVDPLYFRVANIAYTKFINLSILVWTFLELKCDIETFSLIAFILLVVVSSNCELAQEDLY